MKSIDSSALDALVLTNPEIGLQTYESFVGDKKQRTDSECAFMSDAVYVPELTYPELQDAIVAPKAAVLNDLYNAVQDCKEIDEIAKEAYSGTTGYRLAEAYFLREAVRLNDPAAPYGLFKVRAGRYQQMNEELYGKPNQILTDAAKKEATDKILNKELVGNSARIFDELTKLWPMCQPSDSTAIRLPQITQDTEAFLSAQIAKKFDIEIKEVQSAWLDKAEQGGFTPDDMVTLFSKVIAVRGLANTICAFKSMGATSLAWSQEQAGVAIGSERDAADSTEDMQGLVIHEEGVHGRRFVNGRKSRVPILGNGLYTEADDGESTDYLSFEEGIAALYQTVASGRKPEWSIANLTHQISLGLAYEGQDFRGVFERMWRVRALFATKDGVAISDNNIQKAREKAYAATVRIFRGTPTHRAHEVDHPLTYNKDLAYLVGRVSAINFWNQNAGNEDMFDALLGGKFDPTNKRHMAIAQYATEGNK